MGDMLTQAEIDALLNGTSSSEEPDEATGSNSNTETLTSQEIDALGEIGNISMGTSATTLFTLLSQKVTITTPNVTLSTWEELSKSYSSQYVAVKVEYTDGLIGSNLLILKQDDVKIITDLMMGGEGVKIEGDLTDLHLSAISEAMNQMIGSSATSMSSMFSKRIDISPPKAYTVSFDSSDPYGEFRPDEYLVKIAFKMVVGNLIDSEIMQLLPIKFAKELVSSLLNSTEDKRDSAIPEPPRTPEPPQQVPSFSNQNSYIEPPVQPVMQPQMQQPVMQQQAMPNFGFDGGYQEPQRQRSPVSVQPVQFQAFDDGLSATEKKNISLIMDLPLQVTVELGRTQKLIKDILEFGSGSVIELDKLAGEPVDILVNGKAIAKGEVVVIDESFGVRITDIIHPSKRL
ncbi:CheC, inhibitor of MCP methylation / FliN fusion protein [Ruminiclostridium papyrosolvens DSM 2782]|uniref:CheC, inhibitor of MCP methylation / FliN fusion protein n=1 Tax=Ruminiclostridium papyrosolvens DSM 2782 TaxID=588581 RepID=F1THN8_9FIRM|nr:flagellar motor switch phosphatase FliY [Ruminiclostridium papyrosolvens]EGD46020.1 CheC, inhibitor of MCP methylation / FliN fusion protein [Ruminiclostridium papyrosolvens DSM 2782]WES32820.1 flagellar motor switch phosphatase FliY [Ruminiclostridium papyrosolvens DSM 2782]